jgi:DMSO/TMAO reductase YedYZ molybdopterin-dependent catalytic subunit
MTISRRKAILVGSSALAGLSAGAFKTEALAAQARGRGGAGQQAALPDTLVEQELRQGFPAALPLLRDGSAPEHEPAEAGPITGRLMWRSQGTPEVADYRDMAIRVDTRGLGRLGGTLRFSDLEQLPQVSHTFLMQCGAPEPTGIVTWGGVRFADFARTLGLHEGVHYCRLTAVDGHYVDEDMTTLHHPQVMLAWMMNGQPIAADHGAPLRLVIPFRYGNRSLKSISSMLFATPALPAPA